MLDSQQKAKFLVRIMPEGIRGDFDSIHNAMAAR